MTKTVKRTLAVVVLSLLCLLFGYSVFTCSQIVGGRSDADKYMNGVYTGKDGTMVVFMETDALYNTDESTKMLALVEYKDGVITMQEEGEDYRFVAVGENKLYDERSGRFLTRSGEYE